MNEVVLLDAGSGGRASQRLIADLFMANFGNDILATLDDAAILAPESARLAMSTDSYTVSPLFFPGGSIGSLAINGTVNDVAMLGAKPLWLSCAFIIEEGLPISLLERICSDMAAACSQAGVKIVTGDTKVVPKGVCDQIFITTTGIGEIFANPAPSGSLAQPGDAVLLNGSVGDHGLTIMSARENLPFSSDVNSDCAPLNKMIADILAASETAHVLRDPTRGGLATTLVEIAEQSGVDIEINEDAVPVKASVREGCAILGLDPLYLANEGKCVCILPQAQAKACLEAMRANPVGKDAAIIGHVGKKRPGKVILRTSMGGERFLSMLEGAPLPRIC